MMNNKTKLELTWIGKDQRPRLEPRILLEDPALSYHAEHRVTDSDLFDSRVIFGDNLLALKALEQEFTSKIKCICIDPPYNTGSAFTHYDDGVEHSLWLSLMRDRMEMLKRLLSPDGSLWVFVDDSESHYLKVLLDELFGRGNFVANVIWQKKFSPQNDALWLSDMHDHILVYAKDKSIWRPNRLDTLSKASQKRSNADNDPRGDWVSVDYTCNKNKDERPNLYYRITNPNTGKEVLPKETAVWRYSQETHASNVERGLVYWGKNGTNAVPRFKNFKAVNIEGQVPTTLWLHEEVGNNQEARKESLQFNAVDPFATPKPERVLSRVVQLATNPGDWVLDSFAGSGTTGAVAHKMGRRFVMIELGEHAHTHILPRLQKVVDGTDQGGISQAIGWQSGGGFRYFKLAPSLLEKDKWGQWVINKAYNPAMLAEAVCKHEGFTYCPSDTEYWNHGYSSEQDHIYVTTQTLTQERLAQISEEVGDGRTLKVCCAAFRGRSDAFPNLSVTKIPNAIATRCEWGRDDYSLQIAALPAAPPNQAVPAPRKNGSGGTPAPSLFDSAVVKEEEVQ